MSVFYNFTKGITLTLLFCCFSMTTFSQTCVEDAPVVACGDVVTGNTQGASPDSTLPFCGTTLTTAPGHWYIFEGTGDSINITASTAGSSYDTKLGVFTGSCESLSCVGGNDDGGPGLTSQVTFDTMPGQNYYIYVTGYSSNAGEYTLTVSCNVQVSVDSGCYIVYNGYAECTDIMAYASYGTPPYSFSWSDGSEGESITVCPTENMDYTVTVTDAEGGTATATARVVYVPQDISCRNNKVQICHVDGKGRGRTLCIDADSVPDHLAHGDSLGSCEETYYTCDSAPSCPVVTAPMDGAMDVALPATIEWTSALGLIDGYSVSVGTTPGGTDVLDNEDAGMDLMYTVSGLDFETTYYVTVTAYNSNILATAEECDSISFTTQQNPCYSAPSIGCGETATGSTADDGIVFGLEFCGTSLNTAPGVWYTFTGTGDVVTVDTNGSAYDTKLGVFTGTCDAPVCLDGDDDGGDSVQSLVTFPSLEGVEYLIYVTGYSSNAGDYQLNVTCEAPPSAVIVTCGETINNTYCYGNNESPDTFIYQSSDGGVLTVQFNSGAVETGWDYLVVYDTDGSELYNDTGSIAGLSFTSTGDTLTFGVDSDGSVSCASGSSCCAAGWDFDVFCGEGNPPPAEYCASSYSNTTDEWIAGVELNTINNTSGSTNYSDFTAISTDLMIGSTYTITITPGYGGFAYGESYGVWIDYNQNYVFDASELVYQTPSTSTTAVSGTFTVPADATSGPTRMRVIQDYGSFNFDPCTVSNWGETEDYTVNIVGGARLAPNANILTSADWSMAPNPTKGNVTLELSKYLLSDVTIDVMNINGKVIYNTTLQNLQGSKYQVELNSSLPTGMYFVRVAANGQVSTKKLMIMR